MTDEAAYLADLAGPDPEPHDPRTCLTCTFQPDQPRHTRFVSAESIEDGPRTDAVIRAALATVDEPWPYPRARGRDGTAL
jgi:hypothetical protein